VLIYLLYLLCSPLLWLLVYTLGMLHAKTRHRHRDTGAARRRLLRQLRTNTKPVILFHAASAGEFEQLQPLLASIDRQRYFVLQTFFSPSIFKKAQYHAHLFDAYCYHPFDFPWSAWWFLRRVKPRQYWVTRHDLWPNHLLLCRCLGIQTILINANFYHRTKGLMARFKRFLLRQFDCIVTGSESLQQRLQQFLARQDVQHLADTRFLQVHRRKQLARNDWFATDIYQTQNIIFGSVDKDDYPVIFSALAQYYPDGHASVVAKQQRLLLVPHEVDEASIIECELYCTQMGLMPQRYSQLDSTTPPFVLIVDAVGMLAELYQYAVLAYVGGGFEKPIRFKQTGVHSVIEPAVFGCAVCFGPNIDLLDEAVQMAQLDAAMIVHDAESMLGCLCLLDNAHALAAQQEKVRAFMQPRIAASTIEKLQSLLPDC
jgi:3-deoxy-D-manno-octulosonic-acid transferase